MTTLTALWRRLETPGHDACRFIHTTSGCEIDGIAVFLLDGQPARISYQLFCDDRWHTSRARIHGFVGQKAIDIAVQRSTSGAWSVNGRAVHGLDNAAHLDLGFTPATNYPQMRDLNLDLGARGDLRVAWMDIPFTGLTALPQHYERRGELTYWYESPSTNYAELLELTPTGLIRQYPRLWQLEE